MSAPILSRPLLASLLATVVATVVVMLTPAAPPHDELATDLLADRDRQQAPAVVEQNRFRRIPAPQESATLAGFTPAPPPAPPPMQPPAPPPVFVAPADPGPGPVPFIYIGQMAEADRTVAFLQAGDDAIAVVPGEQANSQWQLTAINEGALVFFHLPTQQTQELRTGP